MTDNLCQDCGATIKQATVTVPGMFGMPMECRQEFCIACAFARYTRARTYLPRPFKIPRTRYTANGSISPDFIQRFNEHKSHFNQEA